MLEVKDDRERHWPGNRNWMFFLLKLPKMDLCQTPHHSPHLFPIHPWQKSHV